MLDLKDYGITMWEEDKIIAFRKQLLSWYDSHKRQLPWRQTRDPYAIWVSEMMLQQTQVETVIPYYVRFLDHLPDVSDLAKAPEEVLLKLWEGLGYYSRVRHMQEAARRIVSEFNGIFPDRYEDILSLKGIGPYTAGAIASIAYDHATPAIDGNLMRVFSRLFEVDYDIGNPSNRKIFQAIGECLIDPVRPGDFNQALMDLGALIDTPRHPKIGKNPVINFYDSYHHGTLEKYPIKLPKKKPTLIRFTGLIIQNDKDEFFLVKNEDDRLLSGFWSFPLIPEGTEVDHFLMQVYGLEVKWEATAIAAITHVFSHRKWQVALQEGQTLSTTPRSGKWVSAADFDAYPFAKPQQKMWESYQKSVTSSKNG